MTQDKIKELRLAVVVSRFNSEITQRLLNSCLKTLHEHGVRDSSIFTLHVPGAFEIPWAAQELALSGRFHAVICLGAVLKGQTAQNAFLSSATILHLQSLSLSSRVPCILGIITPDTHEQALARTKGKLDRGSEAALAALEMAKLKFSQPWRER